MIRIDLRPVWRFRTRAGEREFDFQLIAILGELDASGKLTQAAEKAGVSYRHAWNLVGEWEAFFGSPLVAKERGRGSSLTALGERLLWAGRRAQARLAPDLENLAADFERSLNEPFKEAANQLVVQASHDFAVGALRGLAADSGINLDLQYRGSFDALAALRRGECEVAGFHVPEGPLGQLMRARYAEGLAFGRYRLVGLATREQGLVVRPGNPKGIQSLRDLMRPDVRLVNRQRGSGTRALLEFMISREGLDRERIRGYDSEEATHGAVAALIAGQQADVGLGVKAAAVAYRLDFVPVCTERYYLACHANALDAPAMRKLIALLRSPAFRDAVVALPGYTASQAGMLLESLEAVPAGR
jgi:putative molybdopterin biosynthesis protein